jgi:uncharacterized membrane protein
MAKSTRRLNDNSGVGIAVGAGIGTALGAAFHQLALGVALGAAFGALIDVYSHFKRKKRIDAETAAEDDS